MVKVSFVYDEFSHKWEVEVQGTVDVLETRQAFNACILTCKEVIADLDHIVTKIDDDPARYILIPHVSTINRGSFQGK